MFAMSDAFWNGLWPAATVVLSLLIKHWIDSMARKNLAAKVEEIHVATNGLVQKLGDAKRAQGTAEGIQQEAERHRIANGT